MMTTQDNLDSKGKQGAWVNQVYLPEDTGVGTLIRYSLVYYWSSFIWF